MSSSLRADLEDVVELPKTQTTPVLKPRAIAKEPQSMLFEANFLESKMEGQERKIFLQGSVKVRKKDWHLWAQEGHITFLQQEPRYVRLVGEVQAWGDAHKTKWEAFAEEADYEPQLQRLTLKGNARIRRGKDHLTGQRIIYDGRTGAITAQDVKGEMREKSS